MNKETTTEPKKNKKRHSPMKIFWAVFGITAAVLASVILLLNLIVILSSERSIYEAGDEILTEGSYDCILILGCGVKPDGTPSHMLYDRIATGVSLYKEGIAPKLLMSGDHSSDDYDEVTVMKNTAVGMGVPPEDIFMDHVGLSTYESMVRAAEKFGVTSCVVVTQDYHLTRAIYTADFCGIDAVGCPANLRSYSAQEWRDLREMLARCKAVADGIFRPDVETGAPVDIHGDGNVTNER